MKKILLKKTLALALSLMLLFTLAPVSFVQAAGSLASAYNVYITGSFVAGQTVTAHYTYYHPNGTPENTSAVTYTWYTIKTGDASPSVTQVGTGKELTLTTAMLPGMWAGNSLYVTVQTSSTSDNGTLGEPVYSRMYARPHSIVGKPGHLAYIMPTNYEGTTNAGDILAAHFSYCPQDNEAGGAHLYEWKTYTSLSDTSPVIVQEQSTDNTYQIKAADFGKYIECVITPVTAGGQRCETVSTKNHTGNLLHSTKATVTFARAGAYGNNSYYNLGNYPANILLSDGQSFPVLPRTFGSKLSERYAAPKIAGYDEGFTYDLGEVKTLNGFYYFIEQSSETTVDSTTFSYKKLETDDWTVVNVPDITNLANTSTSAAREVILPAAVDARYVKFNHAGMEKIVLGDFYPIITFAACPTLTLTGGSTIRLIQGAPAFVDPGFTALGADGITDVSGDVTVVIRNGSNQVVAQVDTNVIDTYTITYTLTAGNLPPVVVKRTVVVDDGIRSDGDLAYKRPVTSTNGENGAKLVDGNDNTTWDATATEASATVELTELQYISKFVIKELGDNVTEYEILVANDNVSPWETVYEGTAIGDEQIIEITPREALFVKLNIKNSTENAKIKTFEVILTEAAKLDRAKAALEIDADDRGQYQNFELPTEGIHDTTITWASNNAAISLTGNIATVTRQSVETVVKLTATITYTKEDGTPFTITKDFFVTVLPISKPKALDVHIEGNLVIGDTVSCEYTYYDPAGIPEDTSGAVYAWYRTTNFAGSDAGPIPNAVSKTYTLTEEDKGYEIYVCVTPKSVSDTGEKSWSAMGDAPETISTPEAPQALTPYISTLSPNQTMVVGDTVIAHFVYQERGCTPEGASTYTWMTRETLDGPYKLVKAESTDNTYTLTQDDYGKWIECTITPVTADGVKGSSVTARNHYGNAFLADEVVSGEGSSWGYARKGMNAGRVYCYDPGYFMTGKSGTTVSESSPYTFTISINMSKPYDFDALFLKCASQGTKIALEYSMDGTTFLPLEVPEDKQGISPNIGKEIEFGRTYQAQYIKITLTHTQKETYFTLNSFYPYLTSKAGPSIVLDNPDGEEICQYASFTDTTYHGFDRFGNDVTGNVQISGDVINTSVLGEYDVIYTLEEAGYPTKTVQKTFTVVKGIKTDGDIAYGKSASVNDVAKTELTDGNSNTKVSLGAATGSVVIDFAAAVGVSDLYIGEETSYITDITCSASNDGQTWTPILTNASLTEGRASFEPLETRYLKIDINASQTPQIHTIEATVSEAAKVKLDKLTLNIAGDLTAVTEDLAIPNTGKYGTPITWVSSVDTVVSADGAVTRPTSDQTVILTATISNETLTLTKDISVIVKAREENGQGGGGSSSGGGGGASFGGSSMSGGASNIPLIPEKPVEKTEEPEIPVEPTEPYEVFKDVPDSHWAADYINALYKENIVSGKGEGSYAPEANITRAEFLKLLIETFGLKSKGEAAQSFTDVNADSWFKAYVDIAVELGIANGTGNGEFSPNAPILRRDMAVLVHRAAMAAEKELKKVTDSVLKDHDEVTDYAKDAVKALADAGIINGNENGEFMPDKLANRAQSAKIIYMLKEQVKE